MSFFKNLFSSPKQTYQSAKQTYQTADKANNAYETVSHQSPAVSAPGQVFDYLSKFLVGSKVPLGTPSVISDPIEERRKQVVHKVDDIFQPQGFKQQRDKVFEAQTMQDFQRQKIVDFQNMPEWQKREMGNTYNQQFMSMQDELHNRRQNTFAEQHKLDQRRMNFGFPWNEE